MLMENPWTRAIVMNRMFGMLLCCQRVMVESSLICCISHFVHFVVAAHRGHTETVTYSTVVHNIPPEQKELIHLQEQVKKGSISVDEALDRFKEWQNKKQRLPFTQQVWVWNLFLDRNLDQKFWKQNLVFWLLHMRSKVIIMIYMQISSKELAAYGSESSRNSFPLLFDYLRGFWIWLKSRVKCVGLLRLVF